jgi:subtilisin family serine protease
MQFALFLVGLLCLASAEVPLHRALTAEERVEGEYIISFLKGASKADIVEFMSDNVKMGVKLETIQIHDWQAAFVRLTPEQLEYHLQQDQVLEFVSENRVYQVSQGCTTQQNPEWNLERLSERTLYLGNSVGYTYPTMGANNVHCYIIDTGIYTEHNDFGTRASWGTNTIDSNNSDCHGHGTHVAGTVGGTEFGIAKQCRLYAVKVLNCGGGGTSISVINGIQWVTNNHQKPATANMSLGGGNDPAMINAVAASTAAGVIHVVAAGNSNANACNYSPANAPAAISVVSTTVEPIPGSPTDEQEDARSSFSNYGPCTFIAAPGTLINSAWIGSPTATRVLSGTSMASPHVCGAVALFLSANQCSNGANCKSALQTHGTPNIIDLACTNAVCNQTPNLMCYTGNLCPRETGL